MLNFFYRLITPLRKLRWKLTFSYTLVTVGALLVVELALIGLGFTYFRINSRQTPQLVIQELISDYVPSIRPYLADIPVDLDGLSTNLRPYHGGLQEGVIQTRYGGIQLTWTTATRLEVFIIGIDEIYFGRIPYDPDDGKLIGNPFDENRIPGVEIPLHAALNGEEDLNLLYTVQKMNNKLVGAVPIFSLDKTKVLGALAFTTETLPWELLTARDLLQQFGYSLIIFTLFAGVMGSIFGSLTARNLQRRLQRLSGSAKAWSLGDFSVSVKDTSGDELGVLTDHLNRMAEQLEQLVNKRQELSVIEERNRLARDLHDSVKQQAFAASAQLGAAGALLKRDPEAMAAHMFEAERLIDEVRQELSNLIQELRPESLEGRGLAVVLHEHAIDWSHQSEIEVEVRVNSEWSLPLEVEQTLFRFVQEALSNIARHSQARNAEIFLSYEENCITLSVSDNGIGFDKNLRQPGLGLKSMRERAELLNGILTIDSASGMGTRVSMKCPNLE